MIRVEKVTTVLGLVDPDALGVTDAHSHLWISPVQGADKHDTFFRPKYDPEKNLWPILEGMLSEGWGRQIALATDLTGGGLWKHIGGGPGLAAFLTSVQARLHRTGIPTPEISHLVGANIGRRLANPSKELN